MTLGLVLMALGLILVLVGWAFVAGREEEQRMSDAWLWRQREREMRGHWFDADEVERIHGLTTVSSHWVEDFDADPDDYLGPDDWTIDIELPPR